MGSTRFRLALACFVVSLAGCTPPERAVLIDVHSQGDLDDLTITVISTDSARTWQEPTRTIGRTADDIDADPIRVAVVLGAADTVMVHLDGHLHVDGGGDSHFVATRCYTVDGVTHDSVLLFGPLADIDVDGDGWPPDDSAICREPGPDGRSAVSCDADPYVCPSGSASDCNDLDASIYPGAPTICMDGIDQNCDGMDEPCANQDGDEVDACPAHPTGPCDCNDSVPSINPRATDICNDGIDQDCDGMDACCDADMDGVPACANGLPDCNDDDPTIPGPEVCDGIDNNCNGAVDELDECRGPDLDGDGVAACGREMPGDPCDCDDCDPSVHPGANELCGPRPDPTMPGNGIDDNCDTTVDEGCRPDDHDGDGVEAARDCNDDDPLFFPPHDGITPIENCKDGPLANDCIPTDAATNCNGDTDDDGWLEPAECENNPDIRPDATETCNDVDDDCDGLVDEGLSNGTTGCVGGTSLDFQTDLTNCGGCRVVCDSMTSDVCQAGVCGCMGQLDGAECASGDTCCSGTGCKNLQNDTANCGVCGHACGAGEDCVGGLCTCGSVTAAMGMEACPDTAGGSVEANQCCNDACTDVTMDDGNCGQCGLSCGQHSSCQDRLCACDAPGGGAEWRDCNGDLPSLGNDGCEIDVLGDDLSHCGSCTTVCQNGNASWVCSSGSCVPTCSSGYGNCDGSDANGCERSLNSLTNCGSCGTTCSRSHATATCATRSCAIQSCNGGYDDCNGNDADGCETSLHTTSDCGSCGSSCNLAHATPTCPTGSCRVASCAGGYGDCNGSASDGCETSLRTNSNCGSCGSPCNLAHAGASCASGACGITSCSSGYDDCNGTASDGCETSLHTTSDCGSCGSSCTVANGTPSCSSGTCAVSTCTSGFGDCNGSASDGMRDRPEHHLRLRLVRSALYRRPRKRHLLHRLLRRQHLHQRLRRLQRQRLRRMRDRPEHHLELRLLRNVLQPRPRDRRVLVGHVRHRLVRHRLRRLQLEPERRLRDEHRHRHRPLRRVRHELQHRRWLLRRRVYGPRHDQRLRRLWRELRHQRELHRRGRMPLRQRRE